MAEVASGAEGQAMRTSVADETPESRIVKSVLHFPYSEFGESLRTLIDFGGNGFESPDTRAIMGAYRTARSNGGNVAAYLEGDHAFTLEMYRTSSEAEPPAEVEGDAKKILNRAAKEKITEALATIEQAPSQAFEILQGLQKNGSHTVSSLPAISDAAEFLAEPLAKPDELIAGILHRGSKLALGGGSKSFKTWTLLDLALSVAYGEPWLSRETRLGRVLYVNFEIQPWSWQSRLQAVATAKGIAIESGRLSVWNLRGKAAEYSSLLPKIRDAVKQDFALIILDPIYKLYGFTDENSAGGVAALLNAIEELTVASGAAVAFGAHFSKGNQSQKESIDRISGSGVFARDPDSLLMFTRHETDDAFTVEATLRNFAPMEPFVVRWQYPCMVPDAALDPARLKQANGRKPTHSPDDLLKVLPASGLLAKDWIDTAHGEGISRATFFRLKKTLEQQDRVIQDRVRLLWKPVNAA